MIGPSPGLHIPLIGVAGLPGSGKTHLIAAKLGIGRLCFDDVNNDWARGMIAARAALGRGERVLVCDILFCDPDWRRRLADEIGQPAAWIYFANEPLQCARNCSRRITVEAGQRDIAYELRMIESLSRIYRPEGVAVPVYRSPADPPPISADPRGPIAESRAPAGPGPAA